MSEPYNVSVSVPAEPQLTQQEKDDLKETFTAAVIETLEGKGVEREVTTEIVMPGGG